MRVKSVRIRSFSGSRGKIRTRKTPNTHNFHAVLSASFKQGVERPIDTYCNKCRDNTYSHNTSQYNPIYRHILHVLVYMFLHFDTDLLHMSILYQMV